MTTALNVLSVASSAGGLIALIIFGAFLWERVCEAVEMRRARRSAKFYDLSSHRKRI